MGLVINKYIKMPWERSRWLQTKAERGKEPAFIFACHEYETSVGTVPVMFTPYVAWIHIDDEGTFTFDDLAANISEANYDAGFPESYEEFTPIIRAGESRESADEVILAEWGLVEHLEDIMARLEDLSEFGRETEVNM